MAKIFHHETNAWLNSSSYVDKLGNKQEVKFMGEGRFEILQSVDELKNYQLNIERAGRTCYRSEVGEITLQTSEKFIRGILKRGHESVIEHSLITVKFTNVSRGFTHEMVRHRLCAFSQESTRYVDYAKDSNEMDLDRFNMRFIMPPHRASIVNYDGTSIDADYCVETMEAVYRRLRKAGWSPEDARQFLPNGLCADIVVSANFREWRHIFAMRTQKAAHWEIRDITGKLLVHLKNIIPVLFEDFIFAGYDNNGYPFFEKVREV